MAWRKKLTPAKLVDFLDAALDDANASKAGLVALAGGAGSPGPRPPPPADSEPAPAAPRARPPAPRSFLPETEAYAHLLCVLALTDAGDARAARLGRALSSSPPPPTAAHSTRRRACMLRAGARAARRAGGRARRCCVCTARR